MKREPETSSAAGQPLAHESASLHVSGEAVFTDDIPLPANALHAAFGVSPVAHGRLRGVDLAAVRAAPGVVAVISAADVPGVNDYGPIRHDDPIFATDTVQYAGQSIFAVAASSMRAARRAAKLATFDIEPLPAILDARTALAQSSFVLPTERLARGDADAAIAQAPRRVAGSLDMGGQDHFYLEGQIGIAIPTERGGVLIHSSTQHPTEVQHKVAESLGLHAHDVVVQCRRMGGGFGGKESQPALLACAAAILARKTGRPVKLRLDRDADMIITGKRHDFAVDYEAGFDARGRLLGLRVMLAARCGYSADLSAPVSDRAMCHVDNAYFLGHVEIVSHRCRTNTVSNTAFRGFGGPQGIMAIEAVLDHVARELGRDPLEVRRANFYGVGTRNVTPYLQTVQDNVIGKLVDELVESSGYRDRRARLADFNAASPVVKRGLALTPVKFGISFNNVPLNQAGALVHVYNDGTVLVNHGGTEMGQGLQTKVAQVVATEFGLPIAAVRVTATDTSKVPNTSATAASSGSDLNGKAAQAAARTIRDRLAQFVAERHGVGADAVRFADGHVECGGERAAFDDVARQAYFARIPLSSTGYYSTPKIHWDHKSFTGRPFLYFAYGAAVSEVAIDTLTGEMRLVRIDLLHDAGRSINPALDLGQVEGGFLQGVGWLTCEELVWNAKGELLTHAPSTYKIPTARNWPADARIRLYRDGDAPNREDTIFRSKAVGEPPLMLAISVFHAIRDACASAAGPAAALALKAPATPEAILKALAPSTNALAP